MRRFKYFIDFEKEEKWLDDMAKRGYQLDGKSLLGYEFNKGNPENTQTKVDYRKFKKHEDFVDYCTLFEDSGWKHVAGTKSSGTQYFKKMTDASEEDIFSDKQSKAGKYKRLSDMFMELAICYIPLFAALLTTDAINPGALINPKELYYTPGLWEMAGAEFWNSFLFETPFALLRGAAWLFFPVMIILYFGFATKAKHLYRKTKA